MVAALRQRVIPRESRGAGSLPSSWGNETFGCTAQTPEQGPRPTSLWGRTFSTLGESDVESQLVETFMASRSSPRISQMRKLWPQRRGSMVASFEHGQGSSGWVRFFSACLQSTSSALGTVLSTGQWLKQTKHLSWCSYLLAKWGEGERGAEFRQETSKQYSVK